MSPYPLGMVGEGEKDGWDLETHPDVSPITAAVLFTVRSNHMVTVTGRPQGAKVPNWESARGNPSHPSILAGSFCSLGELKEPPDLSAAESFSPLGS